MLNQLTKTRVLLVDDDNFARRVIRHVIYGLGIENIDEAFNGEEAKKLLGKKQFDLLITDIQMPKMNGLELLKEIRCGKTSAPQDLRVIAVTNLANSDVARATLALDVNGFLTKPMKPAIVSSKINKALAEKVFIRPVEHYESVITNLASLGHHEAPAKQEVATEKLSAKKETETEQEPTPEHDPCLVSLVELKSGMCIRDDIYLQDGTLLLTAGHTLSETNVNRLIDMREILKGEFLAIMPEEDDSQASSKE